MLTLKQKKLLDFINEYFSSYGIFPTYDEMKSALSIKSKSGIHKLISSIEERGFITRIPHKARAIKINQDIILKITDLKLNSFELLITRYIDKIIILKIIILKKVLIWIS